MKRWLLLTVILFVLLITACGGQPDPDDAVSVTEPDRQRKNLLQMRMCFSREMREY